ncbi:supervillin-like [Genypterus blacodes]|uniref:supervillin-like n=1 Tax=Genypterus blacodes TaxID=154954 RepID=UPI003F778275
MDTMENPTVESRAERIARYKAERRRELDERYGNTEELPSKWVRRDGKEAHDPARPSAAGSAGLTERVNGRTRGVTNGFEAESGCQRRQGSQDSASMLSGEGHPVSHGLDAPQLHTRVSVGQLRSALLQQTGSGAQPEKVGPDGGRATSSLDLAVKPGSEGSRRRTRRYLPGATGGGAGGGGGGGGGRKTNDRFRTQPITANEMQESSGLLEAEEEEEENAGADVKTDDRANMSVAAKMSLFKELERSAAPEASAFLKPRSGSGHERRTRRGNEHRFLTQPITCEEMVAISASKPAPPVEAPPLEAPPFQAEPAEADGDESCKLSMSEKLALFNKLSLPQQDEGRAQGAPERRRQKGARYRTQPITVEEVSLIQKGPVQLPAFSLSSHLSDRQQVLSVNLKPSELRLSQPGPDGVPGPAEPGPVPQRADSEPCIRGILKKSRSGSSERSRSNGRDADRQETERQDIPVPPRRERRGASGADGGSGTPAPWRQRSRRRETIACTPIRVSPEEDAPQEERRHRPVTQEQLGSAPDLALSDGEGSWKMNQVPAPVGHNQVSLCDNVDMQTQGNRSHNQEEPESFHADHAPPQCWTNQAFEAQEVSSPPKTPIQPQWRQKVKGIEDEPPQMIEVEEMIPQQEREEEQGKTGEDSIQSGRMAKRAASGSELVSVRKEATPPIPTCGPGPCGPPPCGDVSSTEGEPDLAVLCQTNTPILSSAVAEHRRSVRPSRRTQGSRNPLRALAAREDIRQDYMGDRINPEETNVAEKKSKNSSVAESHFANSEDVSSTASLDAAAEQTFPFSSLMLIHIKGQRRVQVRLVEPSVQSLNSGDCFLLVTPQHCILWSGEFANDQEKAKASELASFIQSSGDLGCTASQVIHLEEGLNSDSSSAADFWNLLGGRTQYRGAGAPEEDELYEGGVVESNCVYRLVENRLVPHEQAWASIPSASLLGADEALVCDFGSEVYLWHGADVSASRRTVALQLTHQVWAGPYDYTNCRVNPLDPTQSNTAVQPRGEGRPSWALFGCLSAGAETSLFRHKFLDWTDGKEAATAPEETQSEPLCPRDATALVSGRGTEGDSPVPDVPAGVDVHRDRAAIALEGGRQTKLNGVSVDTWHVGEFDDSEVAVESTGQLHEGDSYVIRWTYSTDSADETGHLDDQDGVSGQERTAFFLWRGRHSSVSGRDTAAFLSIGTNNQEETQVVVPQGKEPPCFLQLFQGGLVIHRGRRDDASSHAAAWRLFCVRGELPEEGALLEVDCSCAGLRSRGSVVLVNSQQGVLYLWNGCKAQASSREVSKRAVERLTQMCPPELGLSQSCLVEVQVVEEGSEPADFWTALGQMDRKAYDCMMQDPGKYNFTPRLFHLSSSSGSFQAEELHSLSRMPGLVMAMPFVQESLYSVPQPALFLLDNRLEVYLWQSGQAEQTEGSASARRSAMQTALQYCKEMKPKRPPHAYLISEGFEPLTFTNVFPRWERRHTPHTQGDAGQAKLTLVQDALAQLTQTQYPLDELLRSPLPEGVDPQCLEVYLSDQDFQTILEMKRDEYASLPGWKQIDLKKSKGLLC